MIKMLQQNRKSSFVTFSSALPNRKFTLFLRKIYQSVRDNYIRQRNSYNTLPSEVGCGTLLHADEHRYPRRK